MEKKIGWWPNARRKVTAFAATMALLFGVGLALPPVASAASSWWAYTDGRCYVGSTYSTSYYYRTWYRVIDYNWYEEMQGKVDYNYPNLYYPDHADKMWGCTRA